MRLKKKIRREHPFRESAIGMFFFTLAFCLHRFCLWAYKRYTPFALDASEAPPQLLTSIRFEATLLFCILTSALLLAVKRKNSVMLVATVYGRRWEVCLLGLLRRLMAAAGVLAFLLSAGYTAGLSCVKTAAVNHLALPTFFQEASGPEILASTQVICHALGTPDDNTIYLNCLEGFQKMYAQGVRVFEADFSLAADGTVVLRHDWAMPLQNGISSSTVPTREEFLAQPLLDTYTPLSFRDLLLLMEEYPDICIITDSKYITPEIALTQFRSMLDDAEELELVRLFDRIIIQFYQPSMLEALDRVYHFPHYIYTLYQIGFDQTEATFRETAEYCANHHVCGITIWDYWWDPAFAPIAQEYGINIYVHTVNDLEQAQKLLDTGVSAIYTDILTDDILC